MGSDVSKPFGDEYMKKRGGFFGFGSSQKIEMHNMKIVFRGMKGVGKTSLFEVFQGKPCPEEYVPSQEINTTHVFWTNPTTKDRVKIEIWDVMDKSSEGKKDQVSVEKITEMAKKGGVQSGSYLCTDDITAGNISIYQGCHACIFIVDPRNLESIEYFKANIVNIPTHIPILVVANFRDEPDKWKITSDQLKSIIEQCSSIVTSDSSPSEPNPSCSIPADSRSFGTLVGEFYQGHRRLIRLVESSFLEKFGLHSIYLFLAEPFFILRLAQLQSQIINTLQSLHQSDLSLAEYVSTSTYEAFLEARREYERQMEEERRKAEEEAAAKAAAKAAKKVSRTRVQEAKVYDTMKSSPNTTMVESDSENDIVTPKNVEKLASVENFYDDEKAEADLKKTLRHMELQKLVMEDALETPVTELLSDEESTEKRGREGSMCVRTITGTMELKDQPLQADVVSESLLSLSSRSLISGEEDSDSNSVVYTQSRRRTIAQLSDPLVSPSEPSGDIQDVTEQEQSELREQKESKVNPEDETPVIPIDFTEDFTILFRSKSSKDLSPPQEQGLDSGVKPELATEVIEEKKGVSMSARLLGVWNRKTEDEKKKEKKESKFNKFLPMGKAKKEGMEAEESMTGVGEIKTEKEEITGGETAPEGEGVGNSKKTKWEIDQRVMAPMKRMFNSLKPSGNKIHSGNKEKGNEDHGKTDNETVLVGEGKGTEEKEIVSQGT